MSVYSDSAVNYLDNGLSVIPCAPGTKFPGTYSSAHGWSAAYDWQKYGKERKPTGFETKIWDRWPDAGICLALGRQSGTNGLHLVAVDIDTDAAAEVAAIRSVLPGSPCAKRGAKGETQFYLAPESVKSRPYNDANKRRILDLLCEGRQTVMPPSAHPDCQHCGTKGAVSGDDLACSDCGAIGQAYRWITPDALDDFAVADLPVLPDDIAEKLAEALKPFGYEEPAPLVSGEGSASLEGINIHRELNDAALANLSAWIPALQLYKCRQVGGNYKAIAHWRSSSSGRALDERATNLIISPQGIRDKGAEQGYTPIDLVMAACDCDLDTAFRWLQDRVAPQRVINLTARTGNLAALNFKPASAEIAQVPEREVLSEKPLQTSDNLPSGKGQIYPKADKPEIYPKSDKAPKTSVIPPEDCTPPGLIGEIVEWMNRSSPVPVPQLNLAATLTFLGAIYGRRFASPTGARTNLYCIGIADSGFGKSYPLKMVNAIARQSSVTDRFCGPGGIKSDSALRKLLERQNPVYVAMDEIGELFGNILSRRASAHHIGLRELLLALFSAADDEYRGSEGAAERATTIYNPHLNLFGMSTPSSFWSAFSSANAENGLLPRILIFDAGEREPDEVIPELDRDDVPKSIVKALHHTLDVRPIGNLGHIANGPIKPIMADYGPGACEAFVALREEMKARRRASEEAIEKLAYSRFAEHTIKLALIYAIGCDPASPVITEEGLRWARKIVEHTTRALVAGAVDRVADSEYQADYKRVLRIVKGGGEHGIGSGELGKAINGAIDKRRLSDILEQLKGANEIESYLGSGPRGGRPGPRFKVAVP